MSVTERMLSQGKTMTVQELIDTLNTLVVEDIDAYDYPVCIGFGGHSKDTRLQVVTYEHGVHPRGFLDFSSAVDE